MVKQRARGDYSLGDERMLKRGPKTVENSPALEKGNYAGPPARYLPGPPRYLDPGMKGVAPPRNEDWEL